jgi:hypothetical protein
MNPEIRSKRRWQAATVIGVVAYCIVIGFGVLHYDGKQPAVRKEIPASKEPSSSPYITDPKLLRELNSQEGEFLPVAEVNGEGDVFDQLAEEGPWNDYRQVEGTLERRAKEAKAKEAAALAERQKEERKRRSEEGKLLGYYALLALGLVSLGGALWTKRREFTASRLKAVYLAWSFVHLVLLAVAPRPLGEKWDGVRDYGSFYPFISRDDYDGRLSGLFLSRVEQYDFTEFLFYVLAPLVAWHCWRIWNSDKEQSAVA